MNKPGDTGRRSFDLQLALIASAALAAAFLGVAVMAFTRPLSKATSVKIPYTQRATFGYSARAPVGPAYPSGVVSTGDPIFLQLVHRVDVQIRYRVATEAQERLSGTEDVLLRLSGPTGWTRNIQLAPRTHFNGDHANARVTLDLTSLDAMLGKLQMETGVPAGAGYTFAVVPQVHVSGTVAGQPVNSNFAPVLNFQLQSLQLQPTGSLTPSQRATVATAATASNAFGVAGHSVAISTVRWVALVGFLLAAASAMLLTLLVMRGRPFDEAARIQDRYGHRIVPIAGAADDLAWAPFDVPSIKALVRLAENSERLILHYRDNTTDTYLVNDEGTIYRYQARPSGVVWGEWSSDSPKPVLNVLSAASRPSADASRA